MSRGFARRSGTAGVATLEFGLMLPAFIELFLGVVDFSNAYHQQLQLSSTLAASAEYAFTQGQTDSGSTLETEVTSFASTVTGVSLTTITASYNNGGSATNCYCVTASPATYTQATCGSTCSGNNGTAGKFITITGSITYTALFTPNRVFFGSPMSQSVTVRLQ